MIPDEYKSRLNYFPHHEKGEVKEGENGVVNSRRILPHKRQSNCRRTGILIVADHFGNSAKKLDPLPPAARCFDDPANTRIYMGSIRIIVTNSGVFGPA